MNVGIVCYAWGKNHRGGLETHVSGLAKLLTEYGHQVFVHCINNADNQDLESQYNTQGWEELEGMNGIADTDLHPSGWVKIQEQRIFVVSEGGFIDEGKEIIVLSIDGNRVLVRELIK